MFFRSPRPSHPPRRGVTLVEMLVTVALLVLMMAVIVQIFAVATGAVSAARTYQDLDSSLRQIDATIRQDLGNITAKMTPPLNPKDGRGYFEYIENSFPDNQGEDTDDCLRFTVKAPEGQIFTGRFVPSSLALPQNPTATTFTSAQYQVLSQSTPITITSQYAEVIYFLRNGNLYRRVLLVAPDRQPSVCLNSVNSNPGLYVGGVFSPQAPNIQTLVSWQGLNDLSAHPVPSLSSLYRGGSSPPNTIILNTLGMLTNRENRYAAPRFTNDYMTLTQNGWVAGSDGIADDYNGDAVPDFWPTLYFNVALTSDGQSSYPPQQGTTLIYEVKQSPQQGRTASASNAGMATFSTLAFPYIYPYAYSRPDPTGLTGLGWIHSPDPSNGGKTIVQLNALNHAPLDIGDSLPAPSGIQTWWGFPTWRETMSPNWLDPFVYIGAPQISPVSATGSLSASNVNPQQALGLNPFPADQLALVSNTSELLPPMTTDLVGTVSKTGGATTPYRVSAQLYPDLNTSTTPPTPFGSDTFDQTPPTTAASGSPTDFVWKQVWEDDLVMTGVRSFDIKAYDNAYPGYVDLGWGDDGRLLSPYNSPPTAPVPTSTTGQTVPPAVTAANATWSPLLLGMLGASSSQLYGVGSAWTWPPQVTTTGGTINSGVTYGTPNTPHLPDLYSNTLAHEGRMPPLVWDNRPDPQAPFVSPNIGDDTTSVVRLRRTWDTWSTDYTNAPATGVTSGLPYGLGVGGDPPIYPSYPPPYPAPLRGIQIQIRAVDPKNERVKVLTIRQDFSDKLN